MPAHGHAYSVYTGVYTVRLNQHYVDMNFQRRMFVPSKVECMACVVWYVGWIGHKLGVLFIATLAVQVPHTEHLGEGCLERWAAMNMGIQEPAANTA